MLLSVCLFVWLVFFFLAFVVVFESYRIHYWQSEAYLKLILEPSHLRAYQREMIDTDAGAGSGAGAGAGAGACSSKRTMNGGGKMLASLATVHKDAAGLAVAHCYSSRDIHQA